MAKKKATKKKAKKKAKKEEPVEEPVQEIDVTITKESKLKEEIETRDFDEEIEALDADEEIIMPRQVSEQGHVVEDTIIEDMDELDKIADESENKIMEVTEVDDEAEEQPEELETESEPEEQLEQSELEEHNNLEVFNQGDAEYEEKIKYVGRDARMEELHQRMDIIMQKLDRLNGEEEAIEEIRDEVGKKVYQFEDKEAKKIIDQTITGFEILTNLCNLKNFRFMHGDKEMKYSEFKDMVRFHKENDNPYGVEESINTLMAVLENEFRHQTLSEVEVIWTNFKKIALLANMKDQYEVDTHGGLHSLSEKERKVYDIMVDKSIPESQKVSRKMEKAVGLTHTNINKAINKLKDLKLI